jgi:hypothetical protein
VWLGEFVCICVTWVSVRVCMVLQKVCKQFNSQKCGVAGVNFVFFFVFFFLFFFVFFFVFFFLFLVVF